MHKLELRKHQTVEEDDMKLYATQLVYIIPSLSWWIVNNPKNAKDRNRSVIKLEKAGQFGNRFSTLNSDNPEEHK